MKPPSAVSIDEIGLDVRGHLFVRPTGAAADEFAYIWRDASGVRWNAKERVLEAAEPKRWDTTELYKQILAAVRREYGVQLTTTLKTRWVRIPDDLRPLLEAVSHGGG